MISNNPNPASTGTAVNAAFAQSLGAPADSSATGVNPGASPGARAPSQRDSASSGGFESHVREDGGRAGNEARTNEAKTGETRTNESKASETKANEAKSGDAKSVPSKPSETKGEESPKSGVSSKSALPRSLMAQIIGQVVKLNPGAQPAALQFLLGKSAGGGLEELPQLMASSRFIADALVEQDLSAYMTEDVKPSTVLRELGFSPDVITQALALGVDGTGLAQRGQVLGALGADPKRVESNLNQLKGVLAMDGVAGYMQQNLALARNSGKQPGIVEKLTGAEVDEGTSDLASFKASTSLEVQAIMAQALVSANSWGPRSMMGPADDMFRSFTGGASAKGDAGLSTDISALSLNLATGNLATETSADTTSQGLMRAGSQSVLPDPSRSDMTMDIAAIQAQLAVEFGDDVRITAIGDRAWEEEDFLASVDDFTGVAGFDAGATGSSVGEVEAPVAKVAEMRTTGIPDLNGPSEPSTRVMPLRQDNHEGGGHADASIGERPAKSPEAETPQTVNSAGFNAWSGQLAGEQGAQVEVAETPASTAKSERMEVNTRHATETVRKIQDAVLRTSVNNIGAMRLDLSSPETGALEIAVRLDQDRQVDVRVMAGSEELRELVARELPQLKSALGEQNLTLREFDTREWTGSQQEFRGFDGGGSREGAGRQPGDAGNPEKHGLSMQAANDQLGRQALRSFRIMDLSDRAFGGAGRIKVLA